MTLRAPDGRQAVLAVQASTRVEPKDVPGLAGRLAERGATGGVIVSRYLSPFTRDRLKSAGLGYADLSGNLRIVSRSPGLFIETPGADRNPRPSRRGGVTLKGAKAGRIVRALCDFKVPIGLRMLAGKAGVDPGYTSRVVAFLDREGLIGREKRGPITAVDWQALLRRWSADYSPFAGDRAASFLDPRGLATFTAKLRQLKSRYAVTGSLASVKIAPVAPSRLGVCYVDDVNALASALDLRPAEAGANVMLVTPFDPVVYERVRVRDGLTCAAPSQVAADLLTSPGRGPAEAETLMKWMAEHPDEWRS